MAPVQPSASVVATGLGFRYISEFVYAYSGTFQASTSPQTVFEGISGAGVIVGEFQYNQPVDPESPQNDETSAVEIKFNDQTVSIMRVVEGSGYGAFVTQKVIIPPFTTISATTESTDNQASMLSTFTFVGRVYGAE